MKTSFIPVLAAGLLLAGAASMIGAAPPPPGPAKPGPGPSADTKHCGKEGPHASHRWGGRGDVAFFCPGGPDPRPPGKPDPKPGR